MTDRFKGKVALISGGATGMGGAASRLFAAEGAKVGIVDRNVEAGKAAVADIQKAGGTAVFAHADVSKSADITRAVTEVNAAIGAITVLFNHAGSIVIKPFLETTEADFDWLMDVNVRSMFLMTQAVLPQMIAAGGGSIVCTSSISAVVASPMEVLYSGQQGRLSYVRARHRGRLPRQGHPLQRRVPRFRAYAARVARSQGTGGAWGGYVGRRPRDLTGPHLRTGRGRARSVISGQR